MESAAPLRDASGAFICFGIFVSSSVLLAPDMAREFWLRGERVPRVARRSRRHHFVLLSGVLASPLDRVYSLGGGGRIRAERQPCSIDAGEMTYDVIAERWVCSSQGAYRLQISTKADPRLNGRAVLTEDGALLGMALSPLGFSGMLLCTPADLVAAHVAEMGAGALGAGEEGRQGFTRLLPPIMLQRVDDSTSRHALFGELRGNFRSVDLRAEVGLETTLPIIGKAGEALRVAGTRDCRDCAPLKYDTFLELGKFVFRNDRFGRVECVAEVPTDEELALMVDEVVFECSSRILKSVNGMRTPTFKTLVDSLASQPSAESFELQWADDRTQVVTFDEPSASFGARMSPRAFVWHGGSGSGGEGENAPPPLPPQQGQGQGRGRGWSQDSCEDPCFL